MDNSDINEVLSMDLEDIGNSSESRSGGDQSSQGSEAILVPIIFSFMVLLGGIGNILVMVVVIKNKNQFKNTTNLFILNLAVADLLFLIFCVPFHAIIYTGLGWPFGEFMCKFVHFVQYSSMVASILTLVAMSFDRYLAVGYPLRTKHMRTPKKALCVAICVWVLSVLIALPWLVFYTVRIYSNLGPKEVTICADDWGKASSSRPTYFLLLFILGYAIPLVTISILSTLMVRQLWIVNEYRCQGTRTLESIKAKRKVTRLVIVIVVVFLVCWLPSHVIWLWTNYFSTSWHHTYGFYYMRIFAHVLSYANSAMNPVIYAFLSQNFRKGFQKALLCKYRDNSLGLSPIPMTRTTSHEERNIPMSNVADFNM